VSAIITGVDPAAAIARFKEQFVKPLEEAEEEAGELLAGSKGDSSDGDSTPPSLEPLLLSEGLRPMFRSATRQESGVIPPR